MLSFNLDYGKDFKAVLKNIDKYRKDIPKIGKKCLAYVLKQMQKEIRKNAGQFKTNKGWTKKDINYYAFDDMGGEIFTASNGKKAERKELPYATTLENGGTIQARNAPFLVFYSTTGKGKNKKGHFSKVKSVNLSGRPYFTPVVNNYWSGAGTKAARLMEDALQKEIDKYLEKKGNGVKDYSKKSEQGA